MSSDARREDAAINSYPMEDEVNARRGSPARTMSCRWASHDQESGRCQSHDCDHTGHECSHAEPRSGTSQPATTSLSNPAAPTPASIAAGKRAYDANCAACHGPLAQGAVNAGMTLSITE